LLRAAFVAAEDGEDLALKTTTRVARVTDGDDLGRGIGAIGVADAVVDVERSVRLL
jgi:hypothetical protein